MTQAEDALSVIAAMKGRSCVRRFRPDPVPDAIIREILGAAARAPSGANAQPWRVHVVTGAARDRIETAVLAAATAGEEHPEYAYYPDEWVEPYLSRRRKVGLDLYRLLGLTRDNKAGMAAQHRRNFAFFDAPVGLFFSMERRFNAGSWLDMGIFIGFVMLAARAHGLETCPQAAWVRHGPTVHRLLDLPGDHVMLCGMSLGYPDTAAPENTLRTERAPVEAFTTFLDR